MIGRIGAYLDSVQIESKLRHFEQVQVSTGF
jgi:hypothetical protein